ncbi:MAG: DNA alkylation repair protein [Syntrophomonadaceae bacterium]|nr:DNA alkylation repair protein [Syntrophomonadaceae bacterium]
MSDIVKRIRIDLQNNTDDKTRKSATNYFKEEICVYGVSTAVVTRIGKEHYKSLKDSSKTEVFVLCEELWKSGYMEEAFIACNWSYYRHKEYTTDDFAIFEHWVKSYVSNWATCDTLCNHTVGDFLQMYPEYLPELKRWAVSDNRWMRRAAAVSLIIPAKQGKFLGEILELADILLMDPDDLVRKGYGWMLKEASKPYQDEIFNYIMKNKGTMPRTSLRYAIEKMPPDLKARAMAK